MAVKHKGSEDCKRKLIITADDLGYSTERNQGIVECYQAGAITRSSLMVNGVAAEHACQLARQCALPLGLHLNLTEGSTFTHGQSLVTADGFMHGMMGFPQQLLAGNIQMDEVRAEIKAQLARFTELVGKKPLYVDGHQHAHILPGISEIFAEELTAHQISETRLPSELDVEKCDWVEPEPMKFIQEVCDHAVVARKVYQAKGVRFPDRFVGMVTMSRRMTTERLQRLTDAAFQCEIPTPENTDCITCELMVHPGYQCAGVGGCGDGADEFSMSEDRVYEMNIIKSKEMLQWYKDKDTQLVPCLA